MKKILIFANQAKNIINFRYHLLKMLVEQGYEVIACASSKENESKRQCEKMGVVFLPIYIHPTSVNIFSNLKYFISLYRIFKKEKPDVVLNYTIKPVIYGSLMARLAGVKKIYSNITGLGYLFTENNFKVKLLKLFITPLYKLALKCNQKVFFQNSDDLELFVNDGFVKKDNVCLIPGSGVDIEFFQSQNFPNEIAFLFLARLIKHKGVREYIAASRQLKIKYPYVKFLLVGDCDANPSSLEKEELVHLKKEGYIDYLGYLDDVRPVLACSSVFVLPSYREGTSKAILEAMSMGRPIITTDAPGCRQTVKEGINGYLVPIKDIKSLIKAMEKFILNPEIIRKMGMESRRIVEEKYDVHKVNQLILETILLEHSRSCVDDMKEGKNES